MSFNTFLNIYLDFADHQNYLRQIDQDRNQKTICPNLPCTDILCALEKTKADRYDSRN